MSMRDYSETNIVNSVAQLLATRALAEGYCIYWAAIDALQINTSATGWYRQWRQNRVTYRTLPAVRAALDAAKGVLTMVPAFPTNPQFVVRLIDELSLGKPDEIPVPAVAIDLSAPFVLQRYGLGTHEKYRNRRLTVDCFARTPLEHARFKDWMSEWFDEDTIIDIRQHDEGTLAVVGEVQILESAVASAQVVSGTEAVTHEVLMNARLVYVA